MTSTTRNIKTAAIAVNSDNLSSSVVSELATVVTLVDSFIGDGIVITDFGSWDISASAIQQINGKLVVSGYSGSSFALARYNNNGSLDISFDRDGKLVTDFGWKGGFYGGAIIQQSSGALVVAGSGYNSTDFNLISYNSDGSIDKTFGKGGTVSTDFGGTEVATSLLSQTDGKLVVAGTASGFVLARYNSDGSLDTSFSDDGKVTLRAFSGYIDVAQNSIQQADSKLVVSGYSRGTSDSALLVRFNKDGSLDTSFDSDGSLLGFFAGSSHAASVAQQTDGKLVVAGNSNGDFALVRLNADGSVDKSFNDGAVVLTDFNATEDSAASVALQADGKIIVAGSSADNFALARYNTDGSLDKSFHDGGKLTTDFGGRDNATAMLIQADGLIVVTGNSDGNFALARYNTDGSLDTFINNPPTGLVSIDNLSPSQGQTLTASNILADVDGLGVISYQWRAGDLVLGTGSSYTLTAGDVDKSISVIASYVDGRGNTEAVRSNGSDPVLPIGISITALKGELGYGITSETGATAQYAIALTGQPTQDLTINFTSSDSTEGSIQNPSLLFNADNWNQTQVLTVQGVDDYINDGNISYSVTGAITTNDVNYATVTIDSLTLVNNDDGRDIALKLIGKLNVSNTLTGMDGADYITGGNLGDIILGGAGIDSLLGGKGNDQIFGGVGNDKLNGDQGNDSVEGGIGNDNVSGGVGDDSLIGNEGNDILSGGDGSDTLTGGIGNDTYYIGYDVKDTVVDNGSSNDMDTVIMPYQLKNYQIPAGIKNCSITAGLEGNVTGNESNNKIIGNDGNNLLDGGLGSDTLQGSAGNDTLTGGTGADNLIGGTGNDVYAVDNARDLVSEAPSTSTVDTGTDSINSFIGSYKLPAYTENLSLMSGAVSGIGNDLNNIITGNDANNTLTGGVGADTMAGGVGGDTYYVDNLNDIVIENPTTPITAVKSVAEKSIIHWDDPPPPPVDTINTNVNYVLPSNVENLTLTGSAPLVGTGNELNNVLTGNTGNNALYGLSGNDTLMGGAGNDTLDGGDDSDVMTGGTGNDVFMFANVINSTTRETITDMNVGSNDTIYLDNGVYTKLTVTGTLNAANFRSSTTGVAVDSNDYLTYNTSTGILSYDNNGNAAGGIIQIALIGTSTHPALTYTDFFVF
ncbi:MAG: hypothetical protein WAX77_01870 [Methylococcaceae bacterium]